VSGSEAMMKQIQVAVLMGGPSAEREVSLRSGAAVARALRAAGAAVTEIDVRGPGFALPANTDVAFVALHGTFGEDGRLQQILEQRGVPYTGSGPAASALAFDKAAAKEAFVEAGVPTPEWVTLAIGPRDWGRIGQIGMPAVVKPVSQGSSVGVRIVRARAELGPACEAAWQHDSRVIVERFVAGRELTVGIFDQQALPVIEVRPRNGWFDYHSKYTPGETEYLVPAPLSPLDAARAQHLARQAHQCLGCRDFSRVDMIATGDGALLVLEVNTIPGFTDTSLVPKAAAAAGLGFEQLCVRLVEMALARAAQTTKRRQGEFSVR
jgi:D-alanine-D-alanine ligase